MCLKHTPYWTRLTQMKIERIENNMPRMWNQKQTGVVILMSDKVDF
jgi:hypothetical protein